jgi:hypothetical protein
MEFKSSGRLLGCDLNSIKSKWAHDLFFFSPFPWNTQGGFPFLKILFFCCPTPSREWTSFLTDF